MNCPFCNIVVKPSPGLRGVYQHAENVDTCIIGDLGIKDLAAWNRRASPVPEAIRCEALEEAAKVAEEFAESHRNPPSHNDTFWTAINLAKAIRSLSPTDGAPANSPKVRTP